MTRTSYWFLLLVSSVVAAVVWSGPERWRAFAEHPHVAAVLDQVKAARARGQAPQTAPAAYQRTAAPAFRPGYAVPQPQQPHAPIQGQAPVQPQQPPVEEIEGAQVIATVGDLVILAEEVIGPINQTLAPYKDKIPAEKLTEARRTLIEKSLKQLIPTKLLYGEYLANVPPEAQTQITKSVVERFAQDRLPEMMKKSRVSSRLDLDAKFRAFGTSLERQRQQFIENSIAGQWMQQSVTYDRDVTYDQMVEYYRKNVKEYEVQEKVRWQQITIRFAKAGSETAAQAEIVRLGNTLWHGANFDDVAKQHSHGFSAHEGGKHDWVARGALASRTLEDAVFALPVGQLSRIIRDDTGFHIVKVLERVEEGITPFTDAQAEIKQKIVKKRRKNAVDAYLSRLEDQTDVWTVFDDAPAREVTRGLGSGPQR